MKKYRVTTSCLADIDYGDILEEVENENFKTVYQHKSTARFQPDIIERNPEWFSPVEEEFQIGDWVKVIHKRSYESSIVNVCRIETKDYSYSRKMRYYSSIPDKEHGFWEDEIERKATKDEIETALIAEAKRRGLIGAEIKSANPEHHDLGSWKCPDGEIEYYADVDGLTDENGWIYYQGEFAEIIDEPIQINGYEVEIITIGNGQPVGCKIGCKEFRDDTIPILAQSCEQYDLSIYREGEDITKQIKQIADKLDEDITIDANDYPNSGHGWSITGDNYWRPKL